MAGSTAGRCCSSIPGAGRLRKCPPVDSAMTSPNRREALAALAGAAALPLVTDAAPAKSKSVLAEENARPGTLDWQLTYTRVDPKAKFRSPMIEGYVSRQSVRAGDALDFFVSTSPATPFHIELFRLGYYGGKGGR